MKNFHQIGDIYLCIYFLRNNAHMRCYSLNNKILLPNKIEIIVAEISIIRISELFSWSW